MYRNDARQGVGLLTVKIISPTGQAKIQSDFHRRDGRWEDVYVSFSGFFGSYGPQMFAAAPVMLEALKAARFALGANAARDAVDAALSLATTQDPDHA